MATWRLLEAVRGQPGTVLIKGFNTNVPLVYIYFRISILLSKLIFGQLEAVRGQPASSFGVESLKMRLLESFISVHISIMPLIKIFCFFKTTLKPNLVDLEATGGYWRLFRYGSGRPGIDNQVKYLYTFIYVQI